MTLVELPSANDHVVEVVEQELDPACANEYAAMFQAYERAGGSAASLQLPTVASLIISGHHVLSINNLPGVHLEAEETSAGIYVHLRVARDTQLDQPVLICFGMIPFEGVQRIIADYEIGADACAAIQTYCTFPNACQIYHRMEATISVGRNATLTYNQVHYHGSCGGIRAIPQALVQVDAGGRYLGTFRLVNGRIGQLDLDHQVNVAAGGAADITTLAYGTEKDRIGVRTGVHLNGEQATGFINNHVAVRDQARSRIFAVAIGNAAGTRGHIDCTEIVRDEALAESNPRAVVRHNQSRITQSANIGAINEQQLAPLLARGLDTDTAVDTIIRGMLN